MVPTHAAGEPNLPRRLRRKDHRRRDAPGEPPVDVRGREHDPIGAVVGVKATEDDAKGDARARDDRLRSVPVIDDDLDRLIAARSRAGVDRLGEHQ